MDQKFMKRMVPPVPTPVDEPSEEEELGWCDDEFENEPYDEDGENYMNTEEFARPAPPTVASPPPEIPSRGARGGVQSNATKNGSSPGQAPPAIKHPSSLLPPSQQRRTPNDSVPSLPSRPMPTLPQADSIDDEAYEEMDLSPVVQRSATSRPPPAVPEFEPTFESFEEDYLDPDEPVSKPKLLHERPLPKPFPAGKDPSGRCPLPVPQPSNPKPSLARISPLEVGKTKTNPSPRPPVKTKNDSEPEDDENYEVVPPDCAPSLSANRPPVPLPGNRPLPVPTPAIIRPTKKPDPPAAASRSDSDEDSRYAGGDVYEEYDEKQSSIQQMNKVGNGKPAAFAQNTKSTPKSAESESLEYTADPDRLLPDLSGGRRLKQWKNNDSSSDNEIRKKAVPPAPIVVNAKLNLKQNKDSSFPSRSAIQPPASRASENNSSPQTQMAIDLKNALDRHKSKAMSTVGSAENSRSASPAGSLNDLRGNGSDVEEQEERFRQTKHKMNVAQPVTPARAKITNQISDVTPQAVKFPVDFPRKVSEPAIMPYEHRRDLAINHGNKVDAKKFPELPKTGKPNPRGPVPTPGADSVSNSLNISHSHIGESKSDSSISKKGTGKAAVAAVPFQRPLPVLPADTELEGLYSFKWYRGAMERKEAEKKVLASGQEGAFLVRKSNKGGAENPYTLTLCHNRQTFNLHLRKRPDEKFALGNVKANERVFDAVSELITFHSNNSLEVTRETGEKGKVKLRVVDLD